MRELPKKREIRKLGAGAKVREIRPIGGKPQPSLEETANADVAVLDEKLKTAEQIRKDKELAIGLQTAEDEKASDFWVAIVFQTRHQRHAWTVEMVNRGLLPEGSHLDTYLSGTLLATAQGITLPPGPKWRPEPVPKARWARLARPIKREE